jgi:hypothetical protein
MGIFLNSVRDWLKALFLTKDNFFIYLINLFFTCFSIIL